RVVSRLRPAIESPGETAARLAPLLDQIDPATASSSVLALRGWMQHRIEPSRAADWFEKSIARMGGEEDPDREMHRVATAGIEIAISAGRHASAANMLRVRAGSSEPLFASAASLRLLALHADHGPLEGFETDMETLRQSLGEPLMLIASARLQDRIGRRLIADALRHVAISTLIGAP
ncbi:MAG TPA: hypothetical protein PKB10_14965, partial [Tepidisphaeraceae bacterium]|nr:hypothetical protein [Tepidisphaeraceae bacterium]